MLERFNRIVLSLARQQGGARARNEPYADALGVRARLADRTIGCWPKTDLSPDLRFARSATVQEHALEAEFSTWVRKLSAPSGGPQANPPPCRDKRSDSKANKDE